MEKLIVITLLLGSMFFIPSVLSPITPAQADEPDQTEILEAAQPIHTESRFGSKLQTEETVLPREIVSQSDPEQEVGNDTVLQEGSDGKKTKVIKITYFEGQEYARDTVSVDTIPPVDKIVSKGTKIVWRTIDTADGQIRYWRKMRVYATHYDSHCPGCDETTAIGMRAGKGVIAVDPNVIKLRSNVYVPGYGKAVAGDTGGAIKGNIIDLGFEDAQTAGWHAQFVEIYLLDRAPS